MPKIRITHDTLTGAASSINNCKSKLLDVISNVDKVVADLKDGWEGEARQGFENMYERTKPVYQQFDADIGKFADFLYDYLAGMETVDIGGRRDIER